MRDAEALVRRSHRLAVGAAPLVRPVVVGLDVTRQVQLAVAYGDYTLEIERWQTFDLSDVLPDPIAAIEWLPSLFYYNN